MKYADLPLKLKNILLLGAIASLVDGINDANGITDPKQAVASLEKMLASIGMTVEEFRADLNDINDDDSVIFEAFMAANVDDVAEPTFDPKQASDAVKKQRNVGLDVFIPYDDLTLRQYCVAEKLVPSFEHASKLNREQLLDVIEKSFPELH